MEEKKIVTLSRVVGIITKEFYTRKFGFEALGDNIKVFYTIEGDIFKVRVYVDPNDPNPNEHRSLIPHHIPRGGQNRIAYELNARDHV